MTREFSGFGRPDDADETSINPLFSAKLGEHAAKAELALATEAEVSLGAQASPSLSLGFSPSITVSPPPPPGTYDDYAGANDFTVFGDPTEGVSQGTRFDAGVSFDGADDYLVADYDALRITGDLSLVFVFYHGGAMGSGRHNLFNVRSGLDGCAYQLDVLDGNVRFYQESSGGTGDMQTGTTDISAAGVYRLSVQRSGANLEVRLNNAQELAWISAVTPHDAGQPLRVATNRNENNWWAFEAYELRVWNTAVAISTLDQITDPADATYEETLEGNEVACWFFEGGL